MIRSSGGRDEPWSCNLHSGVHALEAGVTATANQECPLPREKTNPREPENADTLAEGTDVRAAVSLGGSLSVNAVVRPQNQMEILR